MSSETIPDFHFMAGQRMPLAEIVRAWLAFNELRARKAIWTSFCGREMQNAERAGWDLGIRGSTRERRYLERMESHPFDFFRGYEFGLDVGIAGTHSLVHPAEFASMAAKARSESDGGAHQVSDADVGRWVDQFSRRLRDESALAAKPLASATQQSYETSPLLFRDPFAVYKVSDGKVSIDRSVLGIKFGGRLEVLIQDVREIRASGAIWDDVVFSNSSRDVVVWKSVFRPEAVKRRVERIIRSSQAGETGARQADVPVTIRRERQCPFCAETILVAAKLCKHCHQRLDQGDASA